MNHEVSAIPIKVAYYSTVVSATLRGRPKLCGAESNG